MGIPSAICREAATKRKLAQGVKRSQNGISVRNNDVAEDPSIHRQKSNKPLPHVCRATLSLINTVKCRKGIIRRYFGEEIQETYLNPELPCCDHCLGEHIPPEIQCLLPKAKKSRGSKATKKTPRPPRITEIQQDRLRTQFTQLRKNIWNKYGGSKRFNPYASTSLLDDKELELIISRAAGIKLPEQIEEAIGRKPSRWNGQIHNKLISSLFDSLIVTLYDGQPSEPELNQVGLMGKDRQSEAELNQGGLIGRTPLTELNSTETLNTDLTMSISSTSSLLQNCETNTANNLLKKTWKQRKDKGIKRGPRGPKNNIPMQPTSTGNEK